MHEKPLFLGGGKECTLPEDPEYKELPIGLGFKGMGKTGRYERDNWCSTRNSQWTVFLCNGFS